MVGSSEPELSWFLIPSEAATIATVSAHSRYATRSFVDTTMTSSKRCAPRLVRGATHGTEQHRQQQPRRSVRTPAADRGQQGSPPPGYFSVELALVLLCVAASLAFLPLVLPPLPPPPFLLLLVPVGLLAVLVALAFVPLDANSHLVGSSRS